MLFSVHAGAWFALMASQLVYGWNATIYSSPNCEGSYYSVYPTQEHTKYFEMEGSSGVGMVCTYHGVDNSTAGCTEQIPQGKSVKGTVGLCESFPQAHSIGTPERQEVDDECVTPDFDILSVVCYDP
ncbi:hypothetical protein F5Y18DRAFT_310870 [Xylariaceae sp. FL1019]|nr:hypothetical protein F5Y18DRAFT_310870 [Xylariaceae sp. FL1019]